MSQHMNILVAGNSPNLAYYSWRLYESKACNITIVNDDPVLQQSVANNGITWISEKFNKNRFKPNNFYLNFKELNAQQPQKFDTILLSSTSLQNFSVLCNELAPFITKETIIVVESTGFLQLESYVQQNLNQIFNKDDFIILSIMNDSDIKKIPDYPIYIHQSKNSTDYLYIGNSSSKNSNMYTREEIIAINKLTTIFEQSNAEVLKINSNLEFLNYQWKFALPRVVFNPLLIIFELDHPIKISKQILAKPLISGLLTELLILLKKMSCKLIKGYENENALLNTWSKLYPEITTANNSFLQTIDTAIANDYNLSPSQRANLSKYLFSPNFFYEFYNQFSLDFDPLLLQPILLADDFSIKTPYLEFLYTTVCQFNKLNQSTIDDTSSIFFLRANNSLTKQLEGLSSKDGLESKVAALNNKNKTLEDNNQSLIKQINELSLQLNSQRVQLNKLSNEKNSLQQHLQRNSFQQQQLQQQPQQQPVPGSRRQSLVGQPPQQLSHIQQQQQQLQQPISNMPQRSPRRMSVGGGNQFIQQPPAASATSANGNQLNFDAQYQQPPAKPSSGNGAASGNNSSEDLQDLADMAIIGAKLSGEYRSRTPSPNPPQQRGGRAESLNNHPRAKNGHPVAAGFHQQQIPQQIPPQLQQQHSLQKLPRNPKRMTSVPQTLPSLQSQASFVDKPFGNNSTYLPINDVSARFTPQSRKNRKSGMPMLTSRAASGTNLAQMYNGNTNAHSTNNLAAIANGNAMAGGAGPVAVGPTANGHRQDIDEYSLYGGTSLPNGAVQRPARNRVSSYKNLNALSAAAAATNGNGVAARNPQLTPPMTHQGSFNASANGHPHNGPPGAYGHAAQHSQSAPQVPTNGNGTSPYRGPVNGNINVNTNNANNNGVSGTTGVNNNTNNNTNNNNNLTTETITKTNNSNDSKNSFNSSDGVFSTHNNNSSSIETQNTTANNLSGDSTASYAASSNGAPAANGNGAANSTADGASIAPPSATNIPGGFPNIDRSNTVTSSATKERKKLKMKSFFGKKSKN